MYGFEKTQGGKRYFTRGLIAARYQRHPRTISRWQNDPEVGFPAPDLTINSRNYWSAETLDAFDRSRASQR